MKDLKKKLVLYLSARISECKDSMVKSSMSCDVDDFRKSLHELVAFTDVFDWLNSYSED